MVCGSQGLDRLCVAQVSQGERIQMEQQLQARQRLQAMRLYPSASDSSPDRPRLRRGDRVVIVRCADTGRGPGIATDSGSGVCLRRT